MWEYVQAAQRLDTLPDVQAFNQGQTDAVAAALAGGLVVGGEAGHGSVAVGGQGRVLGSPNALNGRGGFRCARNGTINGHSIYYR